MLFREITIVLRFDWAALVAFDITALQNPFAAQCGQAVLDRSIECCVTPWAGAIVDANGFVRFFAAIK